MKPLEEDTFQEPSSWISNQEPWIPSELDHSVNSSDQTTSFSDKPEQETTGLKVTTLKELNSSTPSSTSLEKKPKVAIASKVSKSPTPSEEELDLVWELSSSPRSEKNIQTDRWLLSLSCHHQRSQIPSLSHTMPPSQSINLSKTPIKLCALITKLFMISASELSSSPLQPMEILTTWSQLLFLELLAASDSQVNSTLTWENLQSTWFHSHVSISSWLDSLHSPQEDPNNTELSLFQNSLNKCSMLRTWCALLIQDTEDTWLPQPCSEEECQPRKSMSKCLTFKTRTLLTSLNGFQTTLNHQFVIFHQRDSRCQLHSSETPLPSKKCLRE